MSRPAWWGAIVATLGVVLAVAYIATSGGTEPVAPAAPPAVSPTQSSAPPLPPVSPAPEPTVPAVPVALGVAAQPEQLRDPQVQALFRRHGITSITAENAMKVRRIHPERRRYAWKDADQVVAFAQRQGLRVRGHTLIWHRDLPDWVKDLPNRAAGRAAMREHITKVMTRYRGKVAQWDVVNEAFDGQGRLRASPWRDAVGDDYVELAFRYAAQADPDAQLFYNDFGIESTERAAGGPAKTEAVLRLVRRLQAAGIRIDGVGLESHADAKYPGTGRGYEANMRLFGSLGLATEITELDVSGRHGRQAQAERYAELGAACQRVPTCTGVTTWGISDRHSWRAAEDPLLFDRQLRPKPALTWLKGALRR